MATSGRCGRRRDVGWIRDGVLRPRGAGGRTRGALGLARGGATGLDKIAGGDLCRDPKLRASIKVWELEHDSRVAAPKLAAERSRFR